MFPVMLMSISCLSHYRKHNVRFGRKAANRKEGFGSSQLGTDQGIRGIYAGTVYSLPIAYPEKALIAVTTACTQFSYGNTSGTYVTKTKIRITDLNVGCDHKPTYTDALIVGY